MQNNIFCENLLGSRNIVQENPCKNGFSDSRRIADPDLL